MHNHPPIHIFTKQILYIHKKRTAAGNSIRNNRTNIMIHSASIPSQTKASNQITNNETVLQATTTKFIKPPRHEYEHELYGHI